MADRVPLRYTVALQGFSDFERSTLASFFRLAVRRDPAYEQVSSLHDADLVIADADQAAAVTSVQDAERAGDTVFVGGSAPDGAGALLPRPIDPARIVRELDALMARHPPMPPATAGADASRPVHDVLVVDDSRIALKFLQLRLQREGFRVHLARNAEEAFDKLRKHRFEIVFLDVVLGPEGSVDGLAVCQLVKQRPAADGHVPAVVMVTGRGSETDRVRGSLAGCDAYLVKPLLEEALVNTLRGLQTVGSD